MSHRRSPLLRTILSSTALGFLLAGTVSASDLASISGYVRDRGGSPLPGALVIVRADNPAEAGRMILTDALGFFSVSDLLSGEYTVQVRMLRFLPVAKKTVRVNAGRQAMLTINLQTALDLIQRSRSDWDQVIDDVVWTLRSAPSTRPVLRLVSDSDVPEEGISSEPVATYSGHFQIFTSSVGTPAGTAEGLGSEFALTLPLTTRSQVTLVGKYSEAPDQPRGFSALYEFESGDRQQSTLAVKVRQGALLASEQSQAGLDMRELNVEYGETFRWSNHLEFGYGAEVGWAHTVNGHNYLRPEFSVSWVPQVRTALTFATTTQAPTNSDDPTRSQGYFDRTVYIPPSQERYSHSKAMLSYILSENQSVSAWVFRDRIDTQALLLESAGGNPHIVILDTSKSPSIGLCINLDRQFRDFEAGIGYTYAKGPGLATTVRSPRNLGDQLVNQKFQVVTARLKASLDWTQTGITAVYRWVSAPSATQLDPYQQFAEYDDPTLSLTITQDLPTLRLVPGKLQAILDARNLFELSFGPQRLRFAHSPRLVKWGLNIRF